MREKTGITTVEITLAFSCTWTIHTPYNPASPLLGMTQGTSKKIDPSPSLVIISKIDLIAMVHSVGFLGDV